MNILSLNPGSSSLKFGVFGAGNECLLRGTNEEIDSDLGGLSEAIRSTVEFVLAETTIDAVGCRVVHGGSDFFAPERVDQTTLDKIRALSPLAPLHNARDVETIESMQSLLPDTPIVAVFDTGFHQDLPEYARQYAIPRTVAATHQIRRHGFHGISYRYVFDQLPGTNRLIVCHLGSGASICAIRDGKSVDTSMGFTPLEGLVMRTRSGDVDPGLILYFQRELGMSTADVDRMLNHESGLAGISGLSGDVRELEIAANRGEASADLALEIFAYRVAKYVGSYFVALEGLDALAFCGGIGENSADMRRRICRRLRCLGIWIDNDAPTNEIVNQISTDGPISVWVIKTDEEQQISKEARAILADRAP